MKRTLFFGLLVMLLALGLIGCGGDDSSNEGDDLTVTFNLDGGNINGNTASVPVPVKKGSTIDNLPPNPTKGTDSFGGWYTAKNGAGSKFDTTTVVTSSITVFAKWTPDSGNGNNPFKGTWTGQITIAAGGTGTQNAAFTITFADTTFEDTVTFSSGSKMKQKGTYTYTASTATTETTAVDYIHDDGESATGGWVSSGEFFEAYGNNLTGTLSNGKLILPSLGELTKTN